ncbi:MAG: WD40/YVTN/BNR-like repeat-containing protein [Vulcanimicrobiaceae bacterium]
MRRLVLLGVVLIVAGCSWPGTSSHRAVAQRIERVKPKDLGVLRWRWIGPAVMGGRLDAVAGVAGQPNIIYLGHSSGGLYRSNDGGVTFDAIFHAGTSSAIGALAIAPSDPKIVYVGTGEGFPRNTASPGDGIFVSQDAGKTWRAAGLRSTEHIAKIAIDPRDPKVAIVAALGPEWTTGGERGLYRTQDGGVTWARVLYVNPTTGGSDVAFDPADPDIVYAGTFDFLRRPWTFRGGGAGSGLYRSSDNGRTWTKLTDPALHDGLPGGAINRVGVSVCFHHPNVVYALVPTKHGVLYRSNDGGAHWKLVNANRDLNFRPFYFSQVRADPNDPQRVYVVSGELKVSTNGGKAFKSIDAGGDNHDLWIDPTRSSRLLLGSDMGFDLSVDRARTWSYINTMPFAQIYRVGYDRALPYHVMGGMQDHEVWWGPSTLWNQQGVSGGDWRNISDWGDGQYAMADPRDPDVVYEDTHFGDLVRRNLLSGSARYISPQPAITFGTGVGSFRYRFNWSAPLLISHHDPNVVYFGANVLFKTTDEGQTWKAISPDLSQPCPKRWLGPSGGPLGHDNTNSESYCTIYAISQDARDPATIWAGTDDGNLDITRDGGAHWTNVIANVPGLPPRSWVSCVHASPTQAGVAYACFDRHRFGDRRPYAFVTRDYGRHWTAIARGLAGYVDVVREDPRQPQLLFAGTEQGVYASFDAGDHWLDLRLGMDHVPVYDLAIQPDANDLILGTHGRGFYILDDITPLEGLARAAAAGVRLFKPMPAYRYVPRPDGGTGRGGFVAANKPYGAIVSYYLAPLAIPKPVAPHRAGKRSKQVAKRPREVVHLQVLDRDGHVIRRLKGTAKAGINRVVWDLHVDPPGGKSAVQDTRAYYVFYPLKIEGPQVLPGMYSIRLRARGRTLTVPVAVKLDPAVRFSVDALRTHYDAQMRLDRLQERAEVWINEIATLHRQIAVRRKRTKDSRVLTALDRYGKQLDHVADLLRNGDGSENSGYTHPARVVDRIAYLRHILQTYDGPPTQAQGAQMDAAAKRIAAIAPIVHDALRVRIRAVNRQLRTARLPAMQAKISHPKARKHGP